MKVTKVLDTLIFSNLCFIDVFGKIIYNPHFLEKNFYSNEDKKWDLDNIDCCSQQILAIHYDLI